MPRLLDLFCGAGGAAVGYHRAGFDVVGVDILAQPHFPFEFHQADALTFPLDGYDAIHASPPTAHVDGRWLVEVVQDMLRLSGKAYVLEANNGVTIRNPVHLCGLSLGLGIPRHRRFETSSMMVDAPCTHRAVPMDGSYASQEQAMAQGPLDMGIDWMTFDELRNALPPAFTQYLGEQLLEIDEPVLSNIR